MRGDYLGESRGDEEQKKGGVSTCGAVGSVLMRLFGRV